MIFPRGLPGRGGFQGWGLPTAARSLSSPPHDFETGLCVLRFAFTASARPMPGRRDLGAALARRGVELVYGGGRVGLMGSLAESVLANGGRVIGVIPRALVSSEVAYLELADLRIVGSMHERKALMAALADAFIALPGGFGTLEEWCEIVTWAQLNSTASPMGSSMRRVSTIPSSRFSITPAPRISSRRRCETRLS